MRTSVYIDGYNLYYRALKTTPYKWLDLKKISERLLSHQNHINTIKYFTARAEDRPVGTAKRQALYFDALHHHINELMIYEGHFLSHPTSMRLVQPSSNGDKYARVIKTEEKGSDVNLAVHMLNDAWLDKYDCAVIISNDSDMAESMKLIKTHLPQKILGLVTPGERTKTSRQLQQYADFTRKIKKADLKASQLPAEVTSSIRKPLSW